MPVTRRRKPASGVRPRTMPRQRTWVWKPSRFAPNAASHARSCAQWSMAKCTAHYVTITSGLDRSRSKRQAASVDSNHLCRECDGTGWVLYRSETVEGEFEEAYRLCPNCCAPRLCTGSSEGHLCSRPATVRRGPGYYCKEHIVDIHDGRDVDVSGTGEDTGR
jgi:hypothetical protein